jgi:hypothetical protein
VLGLERIPPRFPHFNNEETGYAVVLADPTTVWGSRTPHKVLSSGNR